MPRVSPDPVQTELPVTPAVEQPILNSPYSEPEEHWVYGKDGKASRMPGRRPATYFWTTQRTGSEQLQMEGITSDYGAEDMPVVNALREDVAKWRKSNYENATQITRQLLRHWHSRDRARRLFFCQLEAAETIIYLPISRFSTRSGKCGQPGSAADESAEHFGLKLSFVGTASGTAVISDFVLYLVDTGQKRNLPKRIEL